MKPVSGGGIPPTNSAIELRLTFREGGAFDFHNTYEQVKERLYQAYMVARESGQTGESNMDFANVHLEQLPAYEASSTVENGEGEPEAPPYEPRREPGNQDDEPRILSPVPIRPTRDTTIGVEEKSGTNS